MFSVLLDPVEPSHDVAGLDPLPVPPALQEEDKKVCTVIWNFVYMMIFSYNVATGYRLWVVNLHFLIVFLWKLLLKWIAKS